ncbi:MAG: thioredoxin domain-containing protein [Flavipsychrobacter sp.]
MANRLIHEQSPYLQQHAHNPVDWYAWGDDAFDRAAKEGKPVLVSIGYAACHWCHVMERESFENEETAAYMNEHFINVKVDREEHPDVDGMYMDAVQAITGNGGWPLNVFVTADRIPFYGGTYFPPTEMYGRLSWRQVLERMNEIWVKQTGEVKMQTTQMLQYLKQTSLIATRTEQKRVSKEVNEELLNTLLKNADSRYGGFGKAPKFPSTMAIKYLLDNYHFYCNESALKQALLSLDMMINGGIYDQIGGGFARYSTDDKWLAPHFEKMLYDNALIVSVLCDAYSLTQNERYKEVIEETIAFCERELSNGNGGYYCAIDADSEGVEGKFYTWTWQEWEALNVAPILTEYFGVVRDGNWEGTNILHVTKTAKEVAEKNGQNEADFIAKIKLFKKQLFAIRAKKIRPSTDDKSLLSWNALMNVALTKAAAVLGDSQYLVKATEHLEWMMKVFVFEDKLLHTWKNGTAKITAKLDDVAYLINAIINYASVTGDKKKLYEAVDIIERVNNEFLHEDKSFYYYSSSLQKDIPVRKVDVYDGALPSANAVMADNLLRLGVALEKNNWIEQGEYMVANLTANSVKYPSSFAYWAQLLQYGLVGMYKVDFIGDNAEKLHAELLKYYVPNAVKLLPVKDGSDMDGFSSRGFAQQLEINICSKEMCLPPVNTVKEVLEKLRMSN